jgi:hypothetical protein
LKRETRHLKLGTAAFLLLFAANAPAIDFIQTSEFSSPASGPIREETWISAQSVRIDTEVSADLFALASGIDLNGRFADDVWAAGDQVNAGGTFSNSLRIVCRSATVSGTVNDSLLAGGDTVKTEPGSTVGGDIFCFGGTVILQGSAAGSTRVIAQNITLSGTFGGDVSLVAGQDINVLPGTVIQGNLTYTAPDALVNPGSVTIGGELIRHFPPVDRSWIKKNLAGHFMSALAALVTGLVFSRLFSRYAGAALHVLHSSRGLCSLAGFAALVIMPMAAFFLLFTLIGLPLSILILLFYGILLYLSKIVVAVWIGSLILKRKTFDRKTVTAPMALGLLILYALTAIEAVGMMVNLLILIFGLGALTLALFQKPVLVISSKEMTNPPNT